MTAVFCEWTERYKNYISESDPIPFPEHLNFPDTMEILDARFFHKKFHKVIRSYVRELLEKNPHYKYKFWAETEVYNFSKLPFCQQYRVEAFVSIWNYVDFPTPSVMVRVGLTYRRQSFADLPYVDCFSKRIHIYD